METIAWLGRDGKGIVEPVRAGAKSSDRVGVGSLEGKGGQFSEPIASVLQDEGYNRKGHRKIVSELSQRIASPCDDAMAEGMASILCGQGNS